MAKKTTQRRLVEAARKIWFYSEQRREALKNAFIRWEKLDGIKKAVYRCAVCKDETTETAVDHIEPCVNPKDGWSGFDVFYSRLFGGALQVVCKLCHRTKTQKENQARKLKRLNGKEQE